MTETKPWTILRLLEWTTDYLAKHGSDSPRLDAEVLLANAKGVPRIQLYIAFEEEPNDETKNRFREMVKRRAEGTPVAYLVGRKEFFSLMFDVNENVLIPRNETEHLVTEAIDHVKGLKQANPNRTVSIADLCTGSGCVAIALAKHLPQSRVWACDLSLEALEVARKNGEFHQVNDRIEWIQSDLMASESFGGQRYDVIVSNPPYISEAEFQQLSKTVRDFEPKLALVADENGLGVIRRILEESRSFLADEGLLLIEHSPMIADALQSLVQAMPQWAFVRFVKDLAGLRRIAVVRAANEGDGRFA